MKVEISLGEADMVYAVLDDAKRDGYLPPSLVDFKARLRRITNARHGYGEKALRLAPCGTCGDTHLPEISCADR